MSNDVAVIGAGFSGLSAATTLASRGVSVTLYEKNAQPGGRARSFSKAGFTFDMGPSWYWMPDVFEKYFQRFGKKPSDYYQLNRLDPSYSVWFGKDHRWEIPADYDKLKSLFERTEPGAGAKLDTFLEEAAFKYEVGMNDLVYKPSRSIIEFTDSRVIKGMFRLQLFNSLSTHVRKFFKDERLIQLLEFPVLFLGAKPQRTPALYSLMNYADIKLGTWYPKGGISQVVAGMVALAEELGVTIHYNAAVDKIETRGGKAAGLRVNGETIPFDAVIASADYHHVEEALLEPNLRNYSKNYWNTRLMAPSSLLFYLGVNKRLDNLSHHNLFFDRPFEQHAVEIYDTPQWPSDPLFYVCCPSKTDEDVAPAGHENLFVLMPVAPGLNDEEEIREKYYQKIMKRLEKRTGQSIADHVVYKRSYAHNDFIADYNSFKGNAYGLANTLKQTAVLKPSIKNKWVSNLYYTGQLTVPGPGVPPSLVSGQVVAGELMKEL